MWSISWKMMKRDGRMLVPAGIAILVGSLFIAATFLFGNTMDGSLRKQVSSSFGEANYAIAPKQGVSDADSDLHVVKDYHLDAIRACAGVRGARADVLMLVELSSVDGAKHTNTAGTAVAEPDTLMPMPLVDGRWPASDSEVALPRNAADRLGVRLGDDVNLKAISGGQDGPGGSSSIRMKLVGLNEDKEGPYINYGGASVMAEGAMARLHGEPASMGIGTYPAPYVYLSIDRSQAGEPTLRRIRGLLPKGFQLRTRAAFEDQQIKQLSGQTSIMTTFLLSFGVLAMFVAALVIANTFQVMVARQRRTLALLRTIGAKKGQVRASVLMQSGVLGLISSLLGTLAALGLMALAHAMGLRVGAVILKPIITPPVLLVPVVFGTGMTILASLSSAAAATRVTPLEALRPVQVGGGKRSGKLRLFVACLMIVVGAAVAAWVVYQAVQDSRGVRGTIISTHADTALAIAVGAVALLFLGLLLCANRWIPWVLRGIGALVAQVGPSSKVAVGNISRNPARVAATGTALLIGVTLVSCLGTGAVSAKQTLGTALDSHYSVDVEIDLPKADSAGLDKVRQVKGVKAADMVPVYRAEVEAGKKGADVAVFALTPGQSGRLMNVDQESSMAGGSKLVMPEGQLSGKSQVKAGQGVRLTQGAGKNGGPRAGFSFRTVAGSYNGLSDNTGLYGVALVDRADSLGQPDHYEIWAKSDGTQPAGVFTEDIRQAMSSAAEASVAGGIAMKAMYEQVIDIFLGIMLALLAVAVVIALIGVANTLSLSVIERSKESATLRAIGMTRRQLKRSLGVEALLIALGATLAGLVLGTLFGWIGSYIVFESLGKVALPVDWGMYALIVVVAALAALMASLLPARRAAKTPPVEALAEA
ncbi:ABC transporter permease [Bifidobacterium xylocopae]|uniref:ABC transporter permease n=1 Tax=Bifidobacterium xylocopae TaxID=2493119 RepID=A0A366KEJ7_9BIFI|nr:FtsX-like permease family protein [Bifidobacterium xylocopae]RBP99999.1 ABC transporter permease [Bifidobacterium xylocopae]